MLRSRLRYLFLVAIIVPSILVPSASAQPVTPDVAFGIVWASTDFAVANGTASYSWFWGPTIRAERYEPYTESPGGQRVVRYYDKSRMEITNPNADPLSIWYVTNGLLTVELVTGNLKRGDGPNDVEPRQPATQRVAGDPENNPGTPTYATFASVSTTDAKSNRSTDKTGQPVTAFMAGNGQISSTDSRGVTLSHYTDATGHNIASVFWNWFNNPSSGFRPELGVDWLYAAGWPISEPYWIDSTVGGNTKRVLVQLFERRVLTYTESNNDPYRIEWGNIGMHYQTWRDAGAGEAPCPDSPAGTYLYVADTLNDRIQKFDEDGDFVCEWYGDYEQDGPMARPQALAVDNQNNLYVNAIGRVEKYDRQGRYLGYWGNGINAWDMAIDSQGNIYITDVASSSVKKYDQSGNLVDEWGSLGTGNGQFDSLTGIDIDNQNNVYVADRNNFRVQKFTSGGDYLGQWNADGQEADLWSFVNGVAVDSAGNTYASSGRIYKFNSAGEYVDVFGEVGAIIGIADLVVAPNGNIYGIENIGVEIYRYNSAGDLIDTWGGSGSAQGQFSSPKGIAASSR